MTRFFYWNARMDRNIRPLVIAHDGHARMFQARMHDEIAIRRIVAGTAQTRFWFLHARVQSQFAQELLSRRATVSGITVRNDTRTGKSISTHFFLLCC